MVRKVWKIRKEDIQKLVRLVTWDIWVGDHVGLQHRVVSLFRGLYIIVHGFLRNHCLIRAASLSYTTILSIAPFLAVAFSISKALGVQNTELIRNALERVTAGRMQMVDQIITYIDKTSVKTLGVIGTVLLFVTVLALLSSIERSFNIIWAVKKGRSGWRKFTDYFSVTFLCPIFILLGLSATVGLQRGKWVDWLLSISAFNYAYVMLLKLVPLLMIWLALVFLYTFMPNTKVRLRSAALGALVAAVLWQAAQWGYVSYQVGVAKFNAIYGSFAQFPLFLVWLYISWVIVFIGAEISYAAQNMRVFESEFRANQLSNMAREKIAVLLMLLLTRSFLTRKGPVDVETAAERLAVPARAAWDIFYILGESGLVAQTYENGDAAYVLAVPPESVRLMDVTRALREYTEGEAERIFDERYDFVDKAFGSMRKLVTKEGKNLTLKEQYEQLCANEAEDCL